MQARFVVEPSRLAFFVVVAEIGEVGHG
jgi:hypothetical protein